MRANVVIRGVAFLVLISAIFLGVAGRLGDSFAQTQYVPTYKELAEDPETAAPSMDRETPVPFTPLPPTITPCRACHGPEKDFPVNFRRREDLPVHTTISLNHGGVRVWCLDCHHPVERDFLLPLSDGTPIPFDKSFRLCGKCHGTKYRDWRYGIHGRRTGSWDGKKEYYLCTQCHNPHSPKFKSLEPLPPPNKPHAPKVTEKHGR
ncbi:MAG: hypothetical protein V2B18_08080 [Pseudomonadota bacterium]